MSFDHLPNELLDIILNNLGLPLQQRIQLRSMSTRWLAVLDDKLQKETKVVLRDRAHFKTRQNPDDVLFDSSKFYAELFQQLPLIFPSISELTVSAWSTEYYRQLPELLKKYGSTLKSFSLYGYYDFCKDTGKSFFYYDRYPPTATSDEIAQAINSLANLTSLELFASDLNERMLPFLAPTLSRLERFSLLDVKSNYYRQMLRPLVQMTFNSLTDRCTQLMLHSGDLDLQRIGIFAPTLTHLHLVECTGRYYFNYISQQMTSLQSLTLEFVKKTYLGTDMFTYQPRLEQLSELQFLNLHYLNTNITLPAANVRLLNSVKRLRLSIIRFRGPNFDGQLFCKAIAAWFPALEQFTIKCNQQYHARIAEHQSEFPSSTTVSIE